MNPSDAASAESRRLRRFVPNLAAGGLALLLIAAGMECFKGSFLNHSLGGFIGSFLVVVGVQVAFFATGIRTELFGTAIGIDGTQPVRRDFSNEEVAVAKEREVIVAGPPHKTSKPQRMLTSSSKSSFETSLHSLFTRGRIAYWLLHGGPLALRLGAFASLIVFIVGIVWWSVGVTNIEQVSVSSLSTPLEETPQSYMGLEAFALSGLQEQLDRVLDRAEVKGSFADQLEKFNSRLDANNALRFPLAVEHRGGSRLVNTFLTDSPPDDNGHGFLFVPAIMLPLQEGERGVTDEEIKDTARTDPEIGVSAAIAQEICKFQNVPAFDSDSENPGLSQTPIQAYVITRKGLLRICESNVDHEATYYREQQFSPVSYFPNRPYFWETMKMFTDLTPGKAGTGLKEFFYITKPYVDLGGNGVVVTMSRRIHAPGLTESAVFFDFSLGTMAAKYISQRVRSLSGSAHQATCRKTGKAWSCTGDELSAEEREALKNPISDMFGKIHVFPADQNSRGQIRFTIPLAPSLAEHPQTGSDSSAEQRVILYCTVDLAHLQRLNSLRAAVAGGGFLSFLFFAGALIANFGIRLREQEKAFRMVDGVMAKAPIAYVRLDDDDKLIDANPAFVQMLGFDSVDKCRGAIGRFRELLADDQSRRVYDDIERFRPPGGYEVHLLKIGKAGVIPVRIFGGDVPTPDAKGFPRPTFGIMIPTQEDLN